jgi:hypothetical protein
MEHDYATMKPQISGNVESDRGRGGIESLDIELEGLEKDLAALEVKLGPVLHQYDTVRASEPKPEPSSALRGRATRLSALRSVLAQIYERVDL